MTQKELKELLGISPATFHDWASKENHAKHNLAILLSKLTYDESKNLIEDKK